MAKDVKENGAMVPTDKFKKITADLDKWMAAALLIELQALYPIYVRMYLLRKYYFNKTKVCFFVQKKASHFICFSQYCFQSI